MPRCWSRIGIMNISSPVSSPVRPHATRELIDVFENPASRISLLTKGTYSVERESCDVPVHIVASSRWLTIGAQPQDRLARLVFCRRAFGLVGC
jgi:hypothetical protein